ncbi:hypothetical protein Agabi119p4_5080 [Agaricus bisporus var. burnettii]|uniref:Uncharacterized protein n=1 Tax=Agaricus bisporus var. burnettii TaxID=192524 RepID=A0A8H7KHX2_AGABI|nr:hypothetical protein Agabi119p4_5080 [Agaricus bisporus var. burnettii]
MVVAVVSRLHQILLQSRVRPALSQIGYAPLIRQFGTFEPPISRHLSLWFFFAQIIPSYKRDSQVRNPQTLTRSLTISQYKSKLFHSMPPSVEATFVRSHPSRFLFGCISTSLQ